MIEVEKAGQTEEERNRGGGLKRVKTAAAGCSAAPIDGRLTALAVHDLRTPLNVIGISIRLVEQALPRDNAEVAQDVRVIDENVHLLERMLALLGEYARLFEPGLNLAPSEFSPWRLVDDLLENRRSRPSGKQPPIRLEVQKTCPAVALLDQAKALMAIDWALDNAGIAAGGEPIGLCLRGTAERWLIEIRVDRPPPGSIQSTELGSQCFERLCGSAAERRGLDLALAARVSELFGGTARLEVVPGQGSAIILDWPVCQRDAARNT
jgi:signal transduction histidine kinase